MPATWQERYRAKLALPEDALKLVRSGSRVFIGSGCAEPQTLVRALEAIGDRLADTEIIHTLTLGVAPYVGPKFSRSFRHNAFFVGRNVRGAVYGGQADYTPLFLSEIPGLFRSGDIRIDVALIQVSPPDAHGFCSYGVSVDIVKAAAESASVVIAEINANMPRTLGDSFIHMDDIDVAVQTDSPILEWPRPEADEVISQMTAHVATLIEDGSTVQIGIGAIPQSVLPFLREKNELGVHSEMLSDWVVDLVEAGVVTNRRKTLHPGKVVASFCMGSRRLYDFIDNNPLFEFRPSDYTNDPFVIAQNERMVAINSALEVDLTGQVCADSKGYLFYSGLGGHLDFIRGAARSPGGKPIVVLFSTDREHETSRIVARLSEGAGVITTRGDVHYVVTEYGVASLHGKSIRERALALINVAHPDFRAELLAAAKERRYVYADQVLQPHAVYPVELETRQAFDGLEVLFRPIKPTDERALQEFFYALSLDSRYLRFFYPKKALHHPEAQSMTSLDYNEQMAILALVGAPGREKIAAVGRYFLDPAANTAEVAFVVSDEYQNRGIGTFLFEYLTKIAKQRGISALTAEVLPENARMLSVFYKSNRPIESKRVEDAFLLTIKL